MLNDYHHNEQTNHLLNHFNFYIIPLLNTDGYEYSWSEGNRAWRKTLSQHNINSLYFGVDPNRNFDDHWSTCGVSNNPADENYCGPFPKSEKVVENLSNFIDQNRIDGYIDWHSYGQYILFPPAWSSDRLGDHNDLLTLAKKQNDALRKVNGRNYTYGPVGETLYKCSGGVIDWTYAKNNIKYSFCVELPGIEKGLAGFMIPPDHIIEIGNES